MTMRRFSNFLPTFLLQKLPQNVSSLSVLWETIFLSCTTFTPTLLAIECSGPHLRSFAQGSANKHSKKPQAAIITSSNEHAFPHTNDMIPSASLIKVFQYFLLRVGGLAYFFDMPSLGNPTIINKASQMALWILQPFHLTLLKTKSLHSIQIGHKMVPLKKDHTFSTQWKHLDTLQVKITCFHCIGEAS